VGGGYNERSRAETDIGIQVNFTAVRGPSMGADCLSTYGLCTGQVDVSAPKRCATRLWGICERSKLISYSLTFGVLRRGIRYVTSVDLAESLRMMVYVENLLYI